LILFLGHILHNLTAADKVCVATKEGIIPVAKVLALLKIASPS
jgi:hypothetical protein